ncbi:MAG: stage III sporulation protein AG [Lachnospiraceae bacterium]|nr:stage III sporulation protein AG [Lachnospiraceae bacterium]
MKKMLEQIGIKKTLILFAAGLCLIFLSLPHSETKKEESEEEVTEAADEQQEVKALEKRLVETLSTVDGVGKVKVMITLKSSKESVLNKDMPYEEEEETDGESTRKSVNNDEETVLIEKDGENVPYVIKELEPEIEGVVVIAQGGSNASVQKDITEAVTALFDVSVNKIKVLKMEDGS